MYEEADLGHVVCVYVGKYVYVAVPGRNQTLLCCFVRSTLAWSFC